MCLCGIPEVGERVLIYYFRTQGRLDIDATKRGSFLELSSLSLDKFFLSSVATCILNSIFFGNTLWTGFGSPLLKSLCINGHGDRASPPRVGRIMVLGITSGHSRMAVGESDWIYELITHCGHVSCKGFCIIAAMEQLERSLDSYRTQSMIFTLIAHTRSSRNGQKLVSFVLELNTVRRSGTFSYSWSAKRKFRQSILFVPGCFHHTLTLFMLCPES